MSICVPSLASGTRLRGRERRRSATVVVILGLRRNFSETTRGGMPRFGRDSERRTAVC